MANQNLTPTDLDFIDQMAERLRNVRGVVGCVVDCNHLDEADKSALSVAIQSLEEAKGLLDEYTDSRRIAGNSACRPDASPRDDETIEFAAKTEVVDHGRGFRSVTRTIHWLLGSQQYKTGDELRFFGRNEQGSAVWWDVTPPDTDYWHVHLALGRAYAFDFLDLMHSPDKDEERVHDRMLACIVREAAQKAHSDYRQEAVLEGFLTVIGEYLLHGEVSR